METETVLCNSVQFRYKLIDLILIIFNSAADSYYSREVQFSEKPQEKTLELLKEWRNPNLVCYLSGRDRSQLFFPVEVIDSITWSRLKLPGF